MHFCYIVYTNISPWKGTWSFIWIKKWIFFAEECVVPHLVETDSVIYGQTNGRTTDNRLSEKLTWFCHLRWSKNWYTMTKYLTVVFSCKMYFDKFSYKTVYLCPYGYRQLFSNRIWHVARETSRYMYSYQN